MAYGNFDINSFKSPSNECSVFYSWVWNAPITKEGIERRLKEYKSAGITGVYILPEPKNFRPYTLKTDLEPEYLSDEYFELVRFTFEKAEENGINMWIYDEGGWPSGGACGKTAEMYPNAAPDKLNYRKIMLKEGEEYTASSDAVSSFINKTKIENGYKSENDTEITEFYLEKSGYSPNFVNLTDKKVTEAFIKNTYEKYYEAVGDKFNKNTVFFTDEPAVDNITLSDDIFNAFKAEYGYDLKDYLYVFSDSSLIETEKEEKVIIDLHRLTGKIFKENFLLKLRDFCREKDISFGGHLDLDHIASGGVRRGYYSPVNCLRAMDVPGVDVIWEQIRYPYGKRDVMAEGERFFPRVAISAARQAGNKLALTESLGVYGEGETFDEMRYVLNFQAVRGINVFNLMELSYGEKGCDALIERPVFSSMKPGFKNLKHFNDYFKRVSYICRVGEKVCDTALYYPAADIALGKNQSEIIASYKKTGEALEKKHIDFDIIDDSGILEAEVTDGGLKLGNAIYKHIVFPEYALKYLPENVKEKVSVFKGEGKAALKINSDSLIYSLRRTENEDIYIFFNEGENAVNEEVILQNKGNIYELDILTGNVYKREKAEIDLACGDMQVFMVSGGEYPAFSDKKELLCEIKRENFEFLKAEKFIFSEKGLYKEDVRLSDIDKNSSADVSFKAAFSLKKAPDENERYCIILENCASSANIEINGISAATFGMTPMRADIDASLLKEENELIITVSNTLANEICIKEEVFKNLPKEIVGPYHERQLVFEKETKAELYLGEVKICRYI